MKKLTTIALLALLPLSAIGGGAAALYLHGVALDDFSTAIFGDGSQGHNTAGVYALSGTGPFGVGVSAVAMSDQARAMDAYDGGHKGALALRVRGAIEKQRQPGNIIRVFDPNTGALIGEYEFELVYLHRGMP